MQESSTKTFRVAVAGAKGRMGSETVRAVSDASDMVVVAEIQRGDDLATTLSDTRPDVLVEFSIPESVMANVRAALAARVIPIIGTTGISDSDRREIVTLCARHETPALIAPNFALGAVLMMRFAAEAARYLPDVEIIEMHHERKLDAPSGTAARTAEMVARSREESGMVAKGTPSGTFETAQGARGGMVAGVSRSLAPPPGLCRVTGGDFRGARSAAFSAPRQHGPRFVHARCAPRDPKGTYAFGAGRWPGKCVVSAPSNDAAIPDPADGTSGKGTNTTQTLSTLRPGRIAVRIFISYLLPLLFFLIAGLVLPYLLTSVLGRAVRDYAETASFVDDAYALRRTALDSENELRGYLLYSDPGFRQQFASSRDEYRQRFRRMQTFVKDKPDGTLDAQLGLADATYRRWYTKFATPEFAAADRALLPRSLGVSRAAARRSENGFRGVVTAMNRLTNVSEVYREQQLRRARSSERWRVLITVAIPAVAIVIAIFLARSFTVAITRPIEELRLATEEVERGDMTRLLLDDFPYDDDEIGDLAQALSRMAQTIGEREAILRAQSEAFASIGRRIEAVLNATNDGIILLDRAEGFSLVNDRFAYLFDVNAEIIRDQTFSEGASLFLDRFKNKAFAKQQFQEWISDWEAVADETMEIAAPMPRTLRIYTAPVRSDASVDLGTPSDAEIIGRIFVFRDVTRETIVDRMKTEFVSTVSHELRTPLTAIKGYVDLMIGGKTGDLNPIQTEFLGMVQASTRRLTDLINDMLDISRIESGRINVRQETVEFLSVVREAVRMMHNQADARCVTLRLEPPSIPLPPVRGDRDRIMQVLVNLLSNAIKYTPSGGAISVTIEQENSIITTCIADTGIGISAEDQNRLFQKFFRADNSTTREVGGTGLGLAITKAILERMHGTIRVESEVGAGSRFYFTLPAAQKEAESEPTLRMETVVPEFHAPAEGSSASRALLLIVDEDPGRLHRITGLFRGLNYVTSGAMKFAEATRRARDLHPDGVLVNLAAEKMNVFALLHVLRSNEQTRRVPIFLCALTQDGDEVKTHPYLIVTPENAPPQDDAVTLAPEDSPETLAERVLELQSESRDVVNIQLELSAFAPGDGRAESVALALQQLVIRDKPIILHLRDFGGQADSGPIISLASPDLPPMTLDSLAEAVGGRLRVGAVEGYSLT
jgi:4-hydroxy-tetrahydrodipicolinate reductase